MDPDSGSWERDRSVPTEYEKGAVTKRAIVHRVRRDDRSSECDCYEAVFTTCAGVTDV